MDCSLGGNHRFAPTGKYEKYGGGCLPEGKCRCGHIQLYGMVEPHDFGDWSLVSECESTRYCKRCRHEEVDDHHHWVDGLSKNFRSFQTHRGDDYQDWVVEMTCSVCGETRDVGRSSRESYA